MFPNASGIAIQGGTLINNNLTNRTSRGMDLLLEWVATGAFHNSDELYDAPKCHPHTRVAVLDDIMKWVGESESERGEFMMWLFGPAGAGKSAIAKRIAEIAADMDILIATFFFSRTSPTRGNKDRFIPTLAYQLAQSISDTRAYIENTVEQDPTVFKKNVLTQIDTLLIKPLQSAMSSTQIIPFNQLIIIDGLDECNDSKAQVAIIEAISRSFTQHNFQIKFLVVSRPEPDIVTSFNCNKPLKSIHRRLALDDTYQPDNDIRLFFSDKFDQIRLAHPLRSTIPISWPTQEMLKTLVAKSSGQFIYASTVVKFVESCCHQPTARLNIILGVSSPGRTNPFAELDMLYNHLLSSVDDIHLTLNILSLYVMTPDFAFKLHHAVSDLSPELFLSLQPGDIQLALINLSSIVTYDESSGEVEILHASLVDFLSDKHRSTTYHIDKANICADYFHRALEYVKGPDGLQAGNIGLFDGVIDLSPWIAQSQLRSEILNFDLGAFIHTSITRHYRQRHLVFPGSVSRIFKTWKKLICDAGLDDTKELLDQRKHLESRFIKIYQTDWRLQLLLALAVSIGHYLAHWVPVPSCRCMDILLEMDGHHLHLVDQDALDLRHASLGPVSVLIGMISRYVDGDSFASAALHCMRFLSHPPTYSKRNECPEMGLIYAEWKATCGMTLDMLCKVLQQANTLPELVQFISHHDFHLSVQKDFSAVFVSQVNAHILAFLSRAGVCVNWRIISAIQPFPVINDQTPSSSWFDKDDEIPTRHFIHQRLDQCCQGADHRLV